MLIRPFFRSIVAVSALVVTLPALAQSFHNAPASSASLKNPDTGKQNAAAGQELYQERCASCHGATAQGSGNIPSLASGATQAAKPGEIFWFITHGDIANGMPAWDSLPAQQRWQIVTYLKYLNTPGAAQLAAASNGASESTATFQAPPPTPPFTDFRYEKPGTIRKITVQDLPAPFATPSAGNGPTVVPRPEGVWPQAPKGFQSELYATGLDNPRLIRTAPNGDFVVAETRKGQIMVFREITADGKPKMTSVFASGLNEPLALRSIRWDRIRSGSTLETQMRGASRIRMAI